ncbi:MAG: hypothetical protein AB7S44_03485 [Spirochaetales bacterium]
MELERKIRQDYFDDEKERYEKRKTFLETKIKLEGVKNPVALRDCYASVKLVRVLDRTLYDINYYAKINTEKIYLDENLFDAVGFHLVNMKYVGKEVSLAHKRFVRSMGTDNTKYELMSKYMTKLEELSADKIEKLINKLLGQKVDKRVSMINYFSFIEFKTANIGVTFNPFEVNFVSVPVAANSQFKKLLNKDAENLKLLNFMAKHFGKEYIADRIKFYKAQQEESYIYYEEPNRICHDPYIIKLNDKLIIKTNNENRKIAQNRRKIAHSNYLKDVKARRKKQVRNLKPNEENTR